MPRALTDVEQWSSEWAAMPLPQEIAKGQHANVDLITDVFDRFLVDGGTALELGGAVGAWSAYLHRRLGYRVNVLDYSPVGVELTRQNFELLGIDGGARAGDLFDPPGDERYDLVFSLGVIEHFDDPTEAVEAHVRRAKPGGTVVLGCPNFRGVNRLLAAYLAPRRLAVHNLATMRLASWDRFERQFGLERRFRGYVTGFEPRQHGAAEDRRLDRRLVARSMRELGRVLDTQALRPLRRLDAGWWSGYCLGVYRVPARRRLKPAAPDADT